MSSPEEATSLAEAVTRAKSGERDALEHLVTALQDDVFRLSLRMTACQQDAQDASQEILIKVITRLDSFRGASSVRTWAYCIAVHHLLDRKKSPTEALALRFEQFGIDLVEGLTAEPDPDPLLAEEVKLGCTLAMLTCLDREHRLSYILAEVFGLSSSDAAFICEVSEETHRQRLSRARRALESFTRSFCGLVTAEAPCSCSKRVAKAEALGRIQRRTKPPDEVKIATREMESLLTTAMLIREHPRYAAPEQVFTGIRTAMYGGLQLMK